MKYWIMLVLLIYGCTSITSDSCQEKAKSLIPSNLTLYWDIHTQNQWQLIPFRWADGNHVIVDLPKIPAKKCLSCLDDVPRNPFFYKGIEVGQKVNYYYSDSMFSYATGDNKFTVQLVLEQLSGTESVYEVNETERYKSQNFRVAEILFEQCVFK